MFITYNPTGALSILFADYCASSSSGSVGYPGGIFDPFGWAKNDIASLQLKEVKNGEFTRSTEDPYVYVGISHNRAIRSCLSSLNDDPFLYVGIFHKAYVRHRSTNPRLFTWICCDFRWLSYLPEHIPTRLMPSQLCVLSGRLAMMAMLGFYAQHQVCDGTPVDQWLAHIADPWNTSVLSNMSDYFVWNWGNPSSALQALAPLAATAGKP
jgi:hypothetical protein